MNASAIAVPTSVEENCVLAHVNASREPDDCDTITVRVVNQPIRDVISLMSAAESATDLLSLEELTERVGVSVRNVRFYTSRGLLPSPIRIGRSGYYTDDHVVRLELVQELQSHGFTLSAIERFMAKIPDN